MTNIRQSLLAAIAANGEAVNDVQVYYLPISDESVPAIVGPVNAGDLPTREFDDGYGLVEGEPTIAFSPRYIYVRCCYDGREWFDIVPRHPEFLKEIPILGDGG